MASTAVWSIRTMTACSICRCPSLPAAIRSRTPGWPSPPCASRAFGLHGPDFEAGIAKAEWPARMQRLTQGKLKALTPPESELWLDGGHNADGGRAIAAALGDIEERVPRPLILIVGMLATKDNAGFLRNFPASRGASSRCRCRARTRACRPRPWSTSPAASASRRRAATRWRPRSPRGADGAVARAAHFDHRLALSGRRGAGAERHAADVECPYFNSFIRSAFFCAT